MKANSTRWFPTRLLALLSCFSTGVVVPRYAKAGPRTSASYSIITDTADAGGKRASSTAYTNDGSAGGSASIAAVAAPAVTAKAGYIGQLYDIVGLIVNSTQPTVDEGASVQLDAWQLLDDATYLAVDAASVVWSAAGSPIGSISGSGLATAELVYENTSASVQGTFGGFSGSLNLTVLNVATDDFGSYAGDGIADDWQAQYFGLDNPRAAPGVDADDDGQDNLLEWTAGLIPTDAGSVFKLRMEVSATQGVLLIFSPVSGRTYTVTYTDDLFALPPWPALPGIPPIVDNGPERAVLDTGAHTVQRRFYRVEITKP